jgi:predicted AAA+ superfamily ATPase
MAGGPPGLADGSRASPRKAHPVDPALSRIAAFARPKDVGHRLEHLIYLELRRRGTVDLGYLTTSAGFDVDFCGRDAEGALRLVQVCASLSDPDTRARELRALDAGMAELGVSDATLVTLREEEAVALPSGSVRVVPAWRWLVEGG